MDIRILIFAPDCGTLIGRECWVQRKACASFAAYPAQRAAILRSQPSGHDISVYDENAILQAMDPFHLDHWLGRLEVRGYRAD